MLTRSLKNLFTSFTLAQRKKASRLRSARAVIGQSRLFDAAWYLDRYPDVAAASADPLDHFIRNGGSEGRHPSAAFDSGWYLRRNRDVAGSGANPLLHYLEHGREEGRSIRGVGNHSVDDADLDPVDVGGKAGKVKPGRVQPVASDFDTRWQAPSVGWVALGEGLPDVANSEVQTPASALLADPEWLVASANDQQQAAADRFRIGYFLSLRSASRTAAPAEAEQLAAFGLGLDAIIDGWFADSATLFVRVAVPAAEASVLSGFQITAAGDLASCLSAGAGNLDWSLSRMELDNPLGPVLLIWSTHGGRILRSALLAYPSLLRGGLHHVELLAAQGQGHSLGSYATALVQAGLALDAAQNPAALRKLVASLKGANGSEILFNEANLRMLAARFGVGLDLLEDGLAASRDELALRLHRSAGACAIPPARVGGGDLLLPPDCFPTLASLVSAREVPLADPVMLAFAEAGTGLPLALVRDPFGAALTTDMSHPALPDAWPRWPGMTVTDVPGIPCAIRFQDSRLWQVDMLMPLPADERLPVHSGSALCASEGAALATVVVYPAGSDDLRALSLEALLAQTIAERLAVIVIGGNALPEELAARFGPGQCKHLAEHDADLADVLVEASSGNIISLGAGICLHDPRTAEALLLIAGNTGVASVGCAIVGEAEVDSEDVRTRVGHFGAVALEGGTYRFTGNDDLLASLLPASAIGVSANDPRVCIYTATVLRTLGFDRASAYNGAIESGGDLFADFAERALAAGFGHLCTTMFRAADLRQGDAAEVAVPVGEGAAPGIGPFAFLQRLKP